MPDRPPSSVRDPARLAALKRLAILDTPAEEVFDELTRMTCQLLRVPVALVTLVDEDRQFFKSSVGLPEPWASRRETPLSHSFCQHVASSGEALVVEDARRDPLLCDNLAIQDLGVVAYAGMPLTTRDGYTVGTLCAIDHQARTWTAVELELLQYLAGATLGRVERSEERFQLVSRATHDVVWDWDLRTDSVWWNDNLELRFGWRQAEIEAGAASWYSRVHPDDVDRVSRDIRAVMDGGGTEWSGEYRFRRADGSYAEVYDRGYVMRDGAGRAVRMVGAMADITERRRTEAQLRQAQKLEAVGQLTAGIAHDFNNILAIVLATSELVASGLPEEADEARNDLREVTAAAQSGAAMIRQLLAISREAALSIAPRSLDAIVQDVAVMLRRLLPKQIKVTTRGVLAESVGLVDAGAVQQILLNLATNARDAMPEGGTLEIGLETVALDASQCAKSPWMRQGDYHRIAVRDSGVGMDEATKQRVFEPFFTTKEPGKGTGPGMAMIYGLAKQHGGCVEVDSAPGRGTEVRVSFPAVAEAARPIAAPSAAAAPRGRGETVLLVEDQEAMRRTGQRVLARLGYQSLVAADGREGLATFAAHEPEIDLVVCDVDLPVLGGFEFYEAVRRPGKRVKALFASGHAARRVQERFGADPDVWFIQKPWTIEEFARAVRDALDG